MTEAEKPVVRDFIYLDVEQLYSLYSQAFGGVADQIVESSFDELETQESRRGSPLSGKSLEQRVGEASLRTESKVLHDYMYNRLEREIKDSILPASGVTKDDYADRLKGAAMVKVAGSAEIDDFDWLTTFLKKYNKIAEAIAYATLSSDEYKQSLRTIEETVRQTKDRNVKSRLKQRLKHAKDPQKQAEEMGLAQDQTMLENLALFAETFYPGRFEITIIPSQGAGDVVFRGVVKKEILRLQPKFLKALYGSYVRLTWTMVGQLTYLPIEGAEDTEEGNSLSQGSNMTEEAVSMRDPFRGVFGASRILERFFVESKDRLEVIVAPLAIYREIILPN